VTCGLRRERVDNRSVVRGIGCFVTGDGGESWDLLEPLTGPDLDVDDVVYTRSGGIVLAAREGVSPSGVGGDAVLLLGSAQGGSWERRTLAGHAPVRLARSSAASRGAE